MSTVEPFGTWQYAQTVCWPAGRAGRIEQARAGSSSTNGRSGTRPRGDLGLGRGRSPRTCRRGGPCRRRASSGVAPRDRAVEREVELEDARPVAEALEPAPVAGREPVAGDRRRSRARATCRTARPGAAAGRPSRSIRRPGLDRARRAPASSAARALGEHRRRRPRGTASRRRVRGASSTSPAAALTGSVERAGSSGRRRPRTAPGPASPRKRRATPRRRLERMQPEPRQPQRPRRRQRHVERRRGGPAAASAQASTSGPNRSPVRVAVARPRPRGGLVDVAAEHDRRAVVERVAERRRRLDPAQAVRAPSSSVGEERRGPAEADGSSCTRRGRSRAASARRTATPPPTARRPPRGP